MMTQETFYRDLGSKARILASFNPYREASRKWPWRDPLTGGPFLFHDIVARERNGQPIHIYEL